MLCSSVPGRCSLLQSASGMEAGQDATHRNSCATVFSHGELGWSLQPQLLASVYLQVWYGYGRGTLYDFRWIA